MSGLSDVSQAKQFMDLLFSPYIDCEDYDTLSIEVRCLTKEGRVKREYFPLSSVGRQEAAWYAVGNREMFDVYVGVLPRAERGGKDTDIPYVAYLFCDIDADRDTSNGTIASSVFPSPGFTVSSGSGGLHCYWRLSRCEKIPSGYRGTLTRLCNELGSSVDRSCTNPGRILRVPGTYNHKHHPPVKVEMHIRTNTPRSLDWWNRNLPQLPEGERIYSVGSGFIERGSKVDPNNIPTGILEWARRPIQKGERHRKLYAAAKWIKNDLGLDSPVGKRLFDTKVRSCEEEFPACEADGIWRRA